MGGFTPSYIFYSHIFNIDTEAPNFISCPSNQTKDALPGLSTAIAVWADPRVNDNSNATLPVTCNRESGSEFEIGKTEVICETHDPSGNEAFCSFTIEVTGKGKIYFVLKVKDIMSLLLLYVVKFHAGSL